MANLIDFANDLLEDPEVRAEAAEITVKMTEWRSRNYEGPSPFELEEEVRTEPVKPRPLDPWRNVFITPETHHLFFNAEILLGEPLERAFAKCAAYVDKLEKRIKVLEADATEKQDLVLEIGRLRSQQRTKRRWF